MFKRKKKKTGVQTPTFRKPVPPPPPPIPPIKPVKSKENKTMYGLNLYIPFEDLNTYIHEHIDEKYEDLTFVPVKVGINEIGLSIDIKLLSASSFEMDDRRYKLDLNKLPKETNKCKD